MSRSLCVVIITTFSLIAPSFPVLGQSVDPLTGRLQMSVPIGGLSVNDISIPISIYNSGSGLRVPESEGEAGLGWSLSAGGEVIRFVRGLPDEINTTNSKGWLTGSIGSTLQSFSPIANDDLSSCSDESSDYTSLEGLHSSYTKDTEPDIFYVNAPGLSASFIFGPDGLPKLLEHQDLIIQFQPLTAPDSLTIVNNLGVTYRFGGIHDSKRERTKRRGYFPQSPGEMNTGCQYYKSEIEFNSSWKLTKISSSATGTNATFNYEGALPGASKVNYNLDSTSYTYDQVYPRRISSIVLKTYTATFSWKNQLLYHVTLSESTSQTSQFTSFEYYNVVSNSVVAKSFLKRIRQNSSNGLSWYCNTTLSHEFEYVDVAYSYPSIPTYINWKKNWGQDFYGYHNGVTSNRNVPTLYFQNSETNGRRLRTYNTSGATVITGQDRNPSTSSAFGALRKIITPTGGYVEIEYEPNKYIDPDIIPAEQKTGMGIRVKKITTQGGEAAFAKSSDTYSAYRAIVKEYDYVVTGGTTSSGVLVSYPKLGYILPAVTKQLVNSQGDSPTVLYTHVKERIPGKGSTVYEFSVPGIISSGTTSGEWKATKSLIARKPQQSGCLSAGNVKNGYYLFPFPPSTNYDFKRGQLTKVTVYSETGTTISEKTTTYSPRTSNPSTVKGLRFEKINDIYYYGIYEMLTGRFEVITQEVIKENSLADPTKLFQTTLAYSYNSNHMMESVTKTLPNSTSAVSYFKYAKDFLFTSPPSTDTAAVAIKALNTANRGATLIESRTQTTIPGSSAVTSDARLTLFRDFGNGRVLPYYLKVLPAGATLTPAAMSGQTLVTDSDYQTINTVKEYDSEGRPLTQIDDVKNTSSIHYATGISMPVATFYDARARQSVFEGFEGPSSYGMTPSGSFQTAIGWTGEKATTFLDGNAKLNSSSTSTELIQKNGNKYRVSCWVYGPSGKTVRFGAMVGTSEISYVTLTNPTANKWNYLEGELNTTSVSSTFWLQVSTNSSAGSTVTVDDILCMPQQARVSLQTALPFKGVTSVSDDRGNSAKTTYDHLGRQVNVLDRYRNLTQRSEYSLKNSPDAKPNVGFITSSTNGYFVNTPYTFTPGPWACDPAITYSWQVNGVGQATGPGGVLNQSFSLPGLYIIKLTTYSSTFGSYEVSEHICVGYKIEGNLSYTVTNSQGQPAGLTLDCNSGNRIVNLITPTPPNGCFYTFTWTKNGQPYPLTLSELTVTGYSPSGSNPVTDVYVATITLDCSAYKECTHAGNIAYSGTVTVEVVNLPNPNCQ